MFQLIKPGQCKFKKILSISFCPQAHILSLNVFCFFVLSNLIIMQDSIEREDIFMITFETAWSHIVSHIGYFLAISPEMQILFLTSRKMISPSHPNNCCILGIGNSFILLVKIGPIKKVSSTTSNTCNFLLKRELENQVLLKNNHLSMEFNPFM